MSLVFKLGRSNQPMTSRQSQASNLPEVEVARSLSQPPFPTHERPRGHQTNDKHIVDPTLDPKYLSAIDDIFTHTESIGICVYNGYRIGNALFATSLATQLMDSFSIYPLSRFESGQTSIRRPRHFLQFSFDEKHEVKVGSEESLRYYYPPYIAAPGMTIPPISLSNGFESWVRSDQNFDGHLDALLATIQVHEESLLEQEGSAAEVKTKADFISWRGMMTKAGYLWQWSSSVD